MTTPTIDRQFERIIPPLAGSELEGLRASLRAHGCREPLVIWAEEGKLLDGHNRFRICREESIDYEVVAYSFPNRRAALNWIIDNQLARRNLSPANVRYLRGCRYNLEKADVEETRKRGAEAAKPEGKSCPPGSTAERIAEQTGVSPRTVKNDGRFAEALDQLGDGARDAIRSGEVKIPAQDIEAIVAAGAESAEDVRRIAEQRRAERAAELRDRRPPNEDGAWGQFNVVDVITDTDEDGEFVKARKLSCGHTIQAARRRPYVEGKGTKSANCPICRPGTRTPHDRQRQERALEAALERAWKDEAKRALVVELVQAGLQVAAMPGRHPDARAQHLLGRVNELRHELRLTEADV